MVVRKVETLEAVKLLTASSDDTNKKLILGTSTARILQNLLLFPSILLKHEAISKLCEMAIELLC